MTSTRTPDLMTPGEVAARFGVDPHTVTRWAKAGRLPAIRTPGGHRRYRRADVEALATPEASAAAPDERGLPGVWETWQRSRCPECSATEWNQASMMRAERDEARAALAALREAVKSEGYALQGLVSRYTRAPGENGDRVADLLTEDAWKAGTRLRALAAAPGETEEGR